MPQPRAEIDKDVIFCNRGGLRSGVGRGARALAGRAPSPVTVADLVCSVQAAEELRSPTRPGSRSLSRATGISVRCRPLNPRATEEVRVVDHLEQFQSAQTDRVLNLRLRVVSRAPSHADASVNMYVSWKPRNRSLQIRRQGRPARSGVLAVGWTGGEKNRPPNRTLIIFSDS